MKPLLILVSAVLALLIYAPSCSQGKTDTPLDVSCNDFITNNHISQQVEVTADNSITLSLCSNPSTGFQWSQAAEISDNTVIQQVDHIYLQPEAKSPIGAPGKQVWTFKGLKKGTATVSLEYSRPGEGGEKGEWTYELTIVVK